jgi:hypothetical protein
VRRFESWSRHSMDTAFYENPKPAAPGSEQCSERPKIHPLAIGCGLGGCEGWNRHSDLEVARLPEGDRAVGGQKLVRISYSWLRSPPRSNGHDGCGEPAGKHKGGSGISDTSGFRVLRVPLIMGT